jgi:HEPN domain-containing protein
MRPTKHKGDSRKYFDWLEISADDLLASRVLLEQEQCYEIVGFHCQQAMEKAFKAYLIDCAGMLVDGHNLTWLCRKAMKYNREFAKWLDNTAEMNRLYIETRYPSDMELRLSPERAREVYTLATELYDFVCDEVYDNKTAAE